MWKGDKKYTTFFSTLKSFVGSNSNLEGCSVVTASKSALGSGGKLPWTGCVALKSSNDAKTLNGTSASEALWVTGNVQGWPNVANNAGCI
jgi:hypothetical protein